jgi:hypothetical protein
VTISVGGVVQGTRTFNSPATTQSVTGLTAGTAYTFTVAAINGIGTGPPSTSSAAVTPNLSPTLTFAAPPSGQVDVAYSSSSRSTTARRPSPGRSAPAPCRPA